LLPIFNTANRIGYEVLDPPLYTGNPYGVSYLACPSGKQCRMSDAGFGIFDGDYTSTPRGYIARPASLGTVNWNGSDKYRVTEIGYPEGSVRAVGRTSGMSSGTIVSTCVSVGVADHPNVVQNCQYIGTYSSQPGDSGGPVFRVTNSPSTHDVNVGSSPLTGQPLLALGWRSALAPGADQPYAVAVVEAVAEPAGSAADVFDDSVDAFGACVRESGFQE